MLDARVARAWAELQLANSDAEVFDGFDAALANCEAAHRHNEHKAALRRESRHFDWAPSVVGRGPDSFEPVEPLDFN